MTIDLGLTPTLDHGVCPHLAVLLRTRDELYPVLASFYALGAKRSGFLVHRAIQGEAAADRERLIDAGLDVEALEANDQLAIVEFDPEEAPESSPEPWQQALHLALSQGFTALWYSRFAVGPDDEEYRRVLPFERAWDLCFGGQSVVTLCPYIVGELSGVATLDRLHGVSGHHEAVLISGDEGLTMLRSTPA